MNREITRLYYQLVELTLAVDGGQPAGNTFHILDGCVKLEAQNGICMVSAQGDRAIQYCKGALSNAPRFMDGVTLRIPLAVAKSPEQMPWDRRPAQPDMFGYPTEMVEQEKPAPLHNADLPADDRIRQLQETYVWRQNNDR